MKNKIVKKYFAIITFLVLSLHTFATNYYVNDGVLLGDVFCTAIGVVSNNGLTASTPKASLSALLTAYGTTGTKVLKSGDIIYVDAGTYSGLDKDLTIDVAGVSIVGASMSQTIFDNVNGDNGFLKIRANNVKLQDFQIINYAKTATYAKAIDITTAAYTGISIDRVQVNKNNGALGLFAIEIGGGSSVTFNGGGVTCNTGVAGGGVQVSGATTNVTFNDYLFYGNNRNSSGSGLRVQAGIVTVNNSTLSYNTLEKNITGSAIYVLAGTLKVINSKINDNYTNLQTASITGGAVLIAGGTVSFKKTIFQNHQQDLSAPGKSWGAAIGATAGSISVDSCTFSGNNGSTTRGVNVYNSGGTLTISNSRLSGNDDFSCLVGNNSGSFTISKSGSFPAYKGTNAVVFSTTTTTSLSLAPTLPVYTGDCSKGIIILCRNSVLSYTSASKCNVGTLMPTFSPSAGLFSSASGLSINTTTGEVNLETSKPSVTYQIKYNTPSCVSVFNLFVGGKIDTLKLIGNSDENIGDSITLKSNVVPVSFSDGNWVSSTPTIANVSNSYKGVVYGYKEGSTTITYTLKGAADCPNAIATKIVNVVPKNGAGIITGDKSVCQSLTKQYTSDKIGGIWTSSNPKVAKIDSTSGLLTTLTPGVILINYSIKGSPTLLSTKEVTILSSTPVKLSSTTNQLCIGSSLYINASANGVWSSLNPSIVSVNTGGMVTGVSAGTTTIQYKTNVNGTCSDSISTIQINVINAFPDNDVIKGNSSLCVNTNAQYSTVFSSNYTKSSDTSVIKMSGNNVYAKKVGTATISFTLYSAGSCPSKVVSMNVSVLPSSSTTLISGEPVICSSCATYLKTSDASIHGKWYSSDPTSATVDTILGKVVGIKYDTVTIFYKMPATGLCPAAAASFHMTIEFINDFLMINGTQTVEVGKTVAFSSAFKGKSQYKHWFSCDTTIASVDSKTGVVTGKGVGTTNIVYAIGKNNSLDTISNRSITVINSLSKAAISGSDGICSGATTQMTASIVGGVWSSSNPAVFSVNSSGLVTGITSGTANVTYTLKGVNNSDSVALKTMNVFTKPVNNGLSVNQQICLGDTTRFQTSSTGGVWTSLDTLIAKVSRNGLIQSQKSGDVFIKYTIKGLGGCSDSSRTSKLTISTYPVPSLQITSSAINNTITLNDTVVFTTTHNNLGSYPSYVWTLNGIVKNNATTETTKINTLNNQDTVQLRVVSNASCISGGWKQITTYSNKIVTTVNSKVKSSEKDILTFSFSNPAINGVISGTNISLTVPAGTNVTALIPTFTNSALSSVKVGATTQVSGITVNNFTSPVTYIVTSEDGTSKSYTITVIIAQAQTKSSSKDITSFNFVNPSVIGKISDTIIDLIVPAGTNVTSLVPTFTSSALSTVKIGSTIQVSGTSVNNFSNALEYIVTAEDGTSKSYLVIVTVSSAPKSSSKDLLSFSFSNPAINGVISGSNISLTVPAGTDVTALIPTFTNSTLSTVKVGAISQISGMTPNNFTTPVTYSVTAEDGTSKNYIVTVTVLSSQKPVISGNKIICEGSTSQLTASSVANSVMPWRVSDTSIVTVSNTGLLTGLKSGKTLVTYRDNSNIENSDTITVLASNVTSSGSLSGLSDVCMNQQGSVSSSLQGGTWTSSDTTVIQFVDNKLGTYKSVNDGTSLLTYTITGNSQCNKQVSTKNITVHAPISVSEITGVATFCVGATSELSSQTTGGTWSSNQQSIAMVDPITGVVTGVDSGTATIAYTVNQFGCISSTNTEVTIIGLPAIQPISGATSVCIGNTVQLSNAEKGGRWSILDTNIVTIDTNGLVISRTIGKTDVIYRTLSNGCTSKETVSFEVLSKPKSSTESKTICSSYTWNNQTYTQSGVYTFTIKNKGGCDSTATLNLTITPVSTSTESKTVCSSYTWNNQTYTQSGVYTFTIKNKGGCDSTATLNLTITPVSTSTESKTVCSSYTWNNQTYTQSGVYTFTIKNKGGCDSTATLNLTITPVSTSTESKTVCSSYTWNNQTYTQSGVYTFTTKNKGGCDSTATLNLTITPVSTSTESKTVCSSYTWNNQTYTQSGVYTFTTKNKGGCDSTAILNLTITVPISNLKISGDSVIKVGEQGVLTSNFKGTWSVTPANLASIDTTGKVTALNEGIVQVTLSVQSKDGCISTTTKQLTINPKVDLCSGFFANLLVENDKTGDATCTGKLTSNVGGGQQPYSYVWSTGVSTANLNDLCAQNYTLTVTDKNNCTLTISKVVGTDTVVNPCTSLKATISSVEATGINAKTCNGSISTKVEGGQSPYNYTWSNGVTTSSITEVCQGEYQLTVKDKNNCVLNLTAKVRIDSTKNACNGFYSKVISVKDDNANCNGEIHTQTVGGKLPYSYKWNNGKSDSVLLNTCVGNYTLTVSDANNCLFTLEKEVKSSKVVDLCKDFYAVISELEDDKSTTNVCSGKIVALAKGGKAPIHFQWNTGDTTSVLINKCAGDYKVTVEDANQCSVVLSTTLSKIVAQQARLEVEITTKDASSAKSCDGTMSVKVLTGTAPYTYSHSNGNVSSEIDSICSGVYTFTVKDAKGLENTSTYVISNPINTITKVINALKDSISMDTLKTILKNDCSINYNAIDSVRIKEVSNISKDSILVTWAVYTSMNTTFVSQKYIVNKGSGVYALALTMYCKELKAIGNYFTATQQFYYKEKNNSTSGAQELAGQIQLNVYPNPFSDIIHVAVDKVGNYQVQLYDLTGKFLSEKRFDNTNKIELSLGHLADGEYLLKVMNDQFVQTRMITK